MVYCVAINCTNSTDKGKKKKGVSFHSFPWTKPALLRTWIHNVRRKDWHPTSQSRLCSEHFTEDCFQEDFAAKYMGEAYKSRRRMLKEDAVPTLFQFGTERKDTTSSERVHTQRRIRGREERQMLDELLKTRSETSTSPETSLGPTRKRYRTSSPGEEGSVPKPSLKDPARKRKRADMESPQQSFAPITMEERTHALIGTPRRVRQDHAYCGPFQLTAGVQTDPPSPPDVLAIPLSSGIPSPVPAGTDWKTDETEEESRAGDVEMDTEAADMEIETTQSDWRDPDYVPSEHGDSDSSGSEDNDAQVQHCMTENKYIIFDSSLEKLMKFCQQCGQPVVEKTRFTNGSLVGFRIKCHGGCSYVWRSQPVVHHLPLGNLLLSAGILGTGNTYTKIQNIAKAVNLQFFSRSTFSKIQREYIYPVIQEAWVAEKAKVVEELKEHENLVLAGDGRCDSPGHSAKYGAYTIMHASGDGSQGSNKIVDIQLVQSSEVSSSNAMEPEGMRRGLKKVMEEDNLPVKILATDQHVTVGSIMRKEFPSVEHQYDVWHLAKNVKKKLTAKGNAKKCQELCPWIQSICNHLWWSSGTCEGDEQLLREKWVSLLNHIVNKHQWTGSVKYRRCCHGQLQQTDIKEILWLKPGSASIKALQEVVTDKRLISALSHLTKFCHTGELEVFHSMLLKYCPKRNHFPYEGMKARHMLAALDWNSRHRQSATTESGEQKYDVVYSKRRKTWVLRARYLRTEPVFLQPLIKRVIEVHQSKLKLPPMTKPADLPAHIPTQEKPSVEDLLKTHQTRLKVTK